MKEKINEILVEILMTRITIEQAENQLLDLFGVSNWLAFDEIKPDVDTLILITNGSFVEIVYFENNELKKPWKYDYHDTPCFNSKQNGLKWQKLNLPTCC